MSDLVAIAVDVAVASGYTSAVTWAGSISVRRLWIVTAIGILVIALFGVVTWWRHKYDDTSLNEFVSVAVIPSLAVSLLVVWLQRNRQPTIIVITVGSMLWLAIAMIILVMSL